MGGNRLAAVALIVLLFGVVSLLGDASYEGLRSYLPVAERSTLGLGGLVGVGEAIAWGLRPVSGLLVELLGGYWAATIAGYGLVPVGVLLALHYGSGPGLALGYWVERLGKAVRGPARDALLGSVAPEGRRGLVFGVHEALDQLGAIIGPLLVYLIVARGAPAWLLALPGAATVPVLLVARSLYPRDAVPATGRGAVGRSARSGLVPALLVLVLGSLTPIPLAVEHVAGLLGLTATMLPLVYAVAMASDALAAVPLGALYDRSPRASIAAMAASALAGAGLLVAGHPYLAAAAAGVAEAGYETVARAMTRGATGYGLLGLARGASAAASIALYSALARALG